VKQALASPLPAHFPSSAGVSSSAGCEGFVFDNNSYYYSFTHADTRLARLADIHGVPHAVAQ
jgi:hypothetical protein